MGGDRCRREQERGGARSQRRKNTWRLWKVGRGEGDVRTRPFELRVRPRPPTHWLVLCGSGAGGPSGAGLLQPGGSRARAQRARIASSGCFLPGAGMSRCGSVFPSSRTFFDPFKSESVRFEHHSEKKRLP